MKYLYVAFSFIRRSYSTKCEASGNAMGKKVRMIVHIFQSEKLRDRRVRWCVWIYIATMWQSQTEYISEHQTLPSLPLAAMQCFLVKFYMDLESLVLYQIRTHPGGESNKSKGNSNTSTLHCYILFPNLYNTQIQ